MRSKTSSKQPEQLLELPRCALTLEEMWSRLAELLKEMSPEEKARVRITLDAKLGKK